MKLFQFELCFVLVLATAERPPKAPYLQPVSQVSNRNSNGESPCPSNATMDTIRAEITYNVSEILEDFTARRIGYTIPACGGGGGWKRVAFLNMSEPGTACPQQWRLYEDDTTGVRACGRVESTWGSCDSVHFTTSGYSYREVCGRITGYQYASPDGLYVSGHLNNIDSAYVDGISVTHGNPRQHVWTFYAGVREYALGCCSSGSSAADFVGTSYFCDTGNPANEEWRGKLFIDQPLWDGVAGCTSHSTCCAPHLGPWFHVELNPGEWTTDDVEIRICGAESTSNEDTPLELVELYIRG